jgi:hypothetical protein
MAAGLEEIIRKKYLSLNECPLPTTCDSLNKLITHGKKKTVITVTWALQPEEFFLGNRREWRKRDIDIFS